MCSRKMVVKNSLGIFSNLLESVIPKMNPGNLCVLSQSASLARRGFPVGSRAVLGKGGDVLGIPEGSGISLSPGKAFLDLFLPDLLLHPQRSLAFIPCFSHYCCSLKTALGISGFPHLRT